jgi:hypothetical protein
VAFRTNVFPSSTRTDNISPFQLIYNRYINADIDCQLQFGAYYLVPVRKMDNTMTPRTVGGIGLGQHGNGTGTCKFFGLHICVTFSANTFQLMPMTSEVIAHLSRMAASDRFRIPKDPVIKREADTGED